MQQRGKTLTRAVTVVTGHMLYNHARRNNAQNRKSTDKIRFLFIL